MTTTIKVKETKFRNLTLGAQFESKSGALWFKRSSKTGVGLTPHQGPKGRHWDYFKFDEIVKGEVLSYD